MRSILPPMPTKPATTKSVKDFGVLPSPSQDQGGLIQQALDSLHIGDWLVFPPGLYCHGRSLKVNVPGVTLWAESGAILLATNPDDTAIAIQADDVGLYNFTLHAITNLRKSATLTARVTIVANLGAPKISGAIVRRNKIENGDVPGTTQANGSSAVGILAHHACDYLIAENYVARTLADGIHSTQGSCNGRVLYNTVYQTGDDMIACVSYMGTTETPATLAAQLQLRCADRLVHGILIAYNTVIGQYSGRGISVVGGEDITIRNNTIVDTTHGAGIILAREQNYLSFGTRNILVSNNTIHRVQTTVAGYEVGGPRDLTGHAAIEINANASPTEAAISTLAESLRVQDILIEANTITDCKFDGVRLNPRSSPYARISDVGIVRNDFKSIQGQAINVMAPLSPWLGICSWDNRVDGLPLADPKSYGAPPAVTGCDGSNQR